MAENTSIEWADHSWSPWWGCTKVSPACKSCYAATLAARFGTEWGPTARRKFQSDAYWNEPLKWNRQAEREGVRKRVFCASMADVFEYLPESHPDSQRMEDERARLWALIEETPALDWLLLTKRPENITVVVPDKWLAGEWPAHAWAGTTVENQQYADERIPRLLEVPARVRFLSMEPLLGPVDLDLSYPCPSCDGEGGGRNFSSVSLDDGAWDCQRCDGTGRVPFGGIHWVITGGESGAGARPSNPDWFRSLRDQCQAAGVPFHFKQYGDLLSVDLSHWLQSSAPLLSSPEGKFLRVGKKVAGRTLDGRIWAEFPEVAHV